MNTWKVILATMVIFGAGVVTGGLLVRHVGHIHFVHGPHGPAAPRPAQPLSPGGPGIEFLRRMERELDLAPEQRERTDKIVRASQERSRKIMEPVAPQIRDESQRRGEAFRAVLTPEQRKRFDDLLKQLQQRPHDQHRPQPPRERPAEGAPTVGQPTNQ